MATLAKDVALVSESDLSMNKGLSAAEVDRRLMTLAKAHRRLESALCFYLQEVEERQLYIEYGHASTVDYARERLGSEDRKTWSLLQMGILKVSGLAPDGLTWEGPFGVIEKPLPLPERNNRAGGSMVREGRMSYGGGKSPADSGAMVSVGARSRYHYQQGNKTITDHVITEFAWPRLTKKTPRVVVKPRGAPEKAPSRQLVC